MIREAVNFGNKMSPIW